MPAGTEDQVDHRKLPRRRGEVLEQAILRAALDELLEVGYVGVTMERIAARARTSKAALYRRWANRAELIAQASGEFATSQVRAPDTGELRSDLLAYLRSAADLLDSAYGQVVRGVMSELLREDQELGTAVREQFRMLGAVKIESILHRAVERGQARPTVLGTRVVTVANDLLRHEYMLWGGPLTDELIADIVDSVYLPLVRP